MTSRPEPAEALARRVEQLSRDLAEAVEQQAAVSQVLAVIGRSASDLEPVFETVLSSAIRLCRADGGGIWQRDGDVFRLVFASGASAAHRRLPAENPLGRDRGMLVGRVGLEGSTVQIADARSDPRYQWQASRHEDDGRHTGTAVVHRDERRSARPRPAGARELDGERRHHAVDPTDDDALEIRARIGEQRPERQDSDRHTRAFPGPDAPEPLWSAVPTVAL